MDCKDECMIIEPPTDGVTCSFPGCTEKRMEDEDYCKECLEVIRIYDEMMRSESCM